MVYLHSYIFYMRENKQARKDKRKREKSDKKLLLEIQLWYFGFISAEALNASSTLSRHGAWWHGGSSHEEAKEKAMEFKR